MGNYLSKMLKQGEAISGALRLVQDNWQNVFTGLGTSRDKTVYGQFVSLAEVPETELTSLYHQNFVAKRIVALKPREMVRQGYVINIEDGADASSAIAKKQRELRASQRVCNAMIWGRLYGGAAVIIGADDGQTADQPLNEEAIKAINFLHVVDKRHLIAEDFFTDPLNDEFFGEPQTYRITPRRGATNMLVHRSRMLIFGGAHTSDEERDRFNGWDHSVIASIYNEIRQDADVWSSAQHLMSDASQAVFKIQGLMSMIAGGQKDVLQTRMQLVDMSRSVARALLLDADGGEEFTRQPSSFTDAQAMLDKFMMRLAAAAEIPVTILFGRSAAGMNATGDADFRWFYDTIRTAQENDLRPQLERLARLIMLAKDGPTGGREPEAWDLKFNPLWQMTEAEQAELEKKKAETDKLYIETDVLLPEEVALSRFRAEGWSGETQIDRDVRESMLVAAPADMPEEEKTELDEPEEVEGKVVLAPNDIAIVVTVNEARASQGLTPWPNAEEGNLTVAEFKARKETEGAAIGAAEGDAADDIAPVAMEAQQALPFGAPIEPEAGPDDDGASTDS